MPTLMDLIGGAGGTGLGDATLGTDPTADNFDIESLLPMLLAQSAQAAQPSGDEGTLGMLAAVNQSPFYQGQPSHSGAGQISEAILPLVTGLLAGRQAERTAKNEALVKQVELLSAGLKLSELSAKLKAASPAGQAARAERATAAGLEAAEMDESGVVKYKRPVAPKDTKYNLLRDSFREQHGRDPSATELKGMVQQFDSYNKAQQLMVIEEAGARKRLMQPAKPETGGRFHDPVLLKPAPASLLQGEAEAGGYVALDPVESRYTRIALSAFDQLNKLDAAATKLLVPSTGSVTDAATVTANRARLMKLRAQGDPDARLFDSIQNLIIFPVTRVAQGSDRLANVDQALTSASLPGDGDTVQSAHGRSDYVRQAMIQSFIDLGFDPDAVRARAYGQDLSAHKPEGSSAPKFNITVPPELMPSVLKLKADGRARGLDDGAIRDQIRRLVEEGKTDG